MTATRATAAMIAATITMLLASCGAFDGERLLLPGVDLPVQIGLAYEIEPGLMIQVTPADKGGLEVALIGEGELSEHVRKIPGGWEITGPATGLVYRVTQGQNGKPLITIVGGTGKIKPVPIAELEPEPVDVVGTPDPPEVIED